MNRKNVTAVLICLNLAFIWGNSALSGDTSGQISGGIMAWLLDLFGAIPWSEFLLRKMGHFCEFALLGFLLMLFWRAHGETGLHAFAMPLLCGMLAACIDETIQVFTPDRGPSVIDVWIDTFGVCCGILFGYLCHIFRNIRKNHREG